MIPETIEKLKAKKTKAKEAGEESESFSK